MRHGSEMRSDLFKPVASAALDRPRPRLNADGSTVVTTQDQGVLWKKKKKEKRTAEESGMRPTKKIVGRRKRDKLERT